MWFYIYIDRQSTNVQNFGTICWFWPWFISSRSRLLFHKLLQRYCNLELDIISFLWCLGLTLIFINFRTSIQGKEMIVTFCISQRGQSKDCVAQRRMGRKLPYKLSLQSGKHRHSWVIFRGGPTIPSCQNSSPSCQNFFLSGGAKFADSVLPC